MIIKEKPIEKRESSSAFSMQENSQLSLLV